MQNHLLYILTAILLYNVLSEIDNRFIKLVPTAFLTKTCISLIVKYLIK
jgi:tRNA pseudouridine-54 N-methylase